MTQLCKRLLAVLSDIFSPKEAKTDEFPQDTKNTSSHHLNEWFHRE